MRKIEGQKEVRYDLYCNKCKHWDKDDEYKEPCDECMDAPTNYATDRPIKCKGAAYIKRFESGTNEIMFVCERFNDIHVARECSRNCSNYALCRQIDKVKQAEAVLDMYYS